jgi:copper chaperone
MAKTLLSVPDISCEHCQRAIEGALGPEPGVHAVHVDIAAKTVFLDYDPARLSLERVGAILDDEGYAVAGTTPA